MKKVAITGILSCGKSSVCRFFRELGAYVVSADALVHHLLENDKDIQNALIALLGKGIQVDGKLSRQRIADKVFKQPKLLNQMEKIIHPEVDREIEKHYAKALADKLTKHSLFVAEIPLLFEYQGNADKFFDTTICVVSDEATCKQRFSEKTGFDEAEFDRRMQRQLSQDEKASRAEYIVENRGTLADLETKTRMLFAQLT